MKITTTDFEYGSGVVLTITADNDTEMVLLRACLDDDGPLTVGDEDTEFRLTLPVSNGG